MTTIMPEGEELRKAVKWISEERQDNPDKKISELIARGVLYCIVILIILVGRWL
jgi:hypothetical protein